MKYYVVLGEWKYIFQAGNPIQACIKTLNRVTNEKYIDVMPDIFLVSQTGFDSGTVEVYTTQDVVKIMALSAEYEPPENFSDDA